MDAQEKIFTRNQFYQRQFYLALATFLISICLLSALTWMVFSLLKYPVRPVYFAVDNIGRLIDEVPVDKPNMDTEAIKDWAIKAIEASYSYDYVNYRDQLQRAQRYFTNFGWRNYMNALRNNNAIGVVTQNKYVFKSRVVDRPKLIAEGLLGNTYAWKFEMPVLVTYWKPPYGEKDKFLNPLKLVILIQRRSVLEGDHGLGIMQIYADFATTTNATRDLQDKPN